MADMIAGDVAAVATMMAVFARERDGQGRQVDVSAMEAVASMLIRDIANYSYAHVVAGRLPTQAAVMPNALMPCKDGWVVIAAPFEHQWGRLVEAMGNPDWASLDVFSDGLQRAVNWDALQLLLQEWTMAHTREEIMTITQTLAIPCFSAFSVGEMMTSTQMREREYFWEGTAQDQRAKVPGPPFKLSETPVYLRSPAPALGEHNLQVLGHLGYTRAEIRELHSRGVI